MVYVNVGSLQKVSVLSFSYQMDIVHVRGIKPLADEIRHMHREVFIEFD